MKLKNNYINNTMDYKELLDNIKEINIINKIMNDVKYDRVIEVSYNKDEDKVYNNICEKIIKYYKPECNFNILKIADKILKFESYEYFDKDMLKESGIKENEIGKYESRDMRNNRIQIYRNYAYDLTIKYFDNYKLIVYAEIEIINKTIKVYKLYETTFKKYIADVNSNEYWYCNEGEYIPIGNYYINEKNKEIIAFIYSFNDDLYDRVSE